MSSLTVYRGVSPLPRAGKEESWRGKKPLPEAVGTAKVKAGGVWSATRGRSRLSTGRSELGVGHGEAAWCLHSWQGAGANSIAHSWEPSLQQHAGLPWERQQRRRKWNSGFPWCSQAPWGRLGPGSGWHQHQADTWRGKAPGTCLPALSLHIWLTPKVSLLTMSSFDKQNWKKTHKTQCRGADAD